MIMTLAKNQKAQTMPFVAGTIVLTVFITLMSLSISSISQERTDQQAVADSAALAGATVLSRADQALKMIDYIIWLRNAGQEMLYLAATTATIKTRGQASFLFTAPIKFEESTRPSIMKLEEMKTAIKEISPIYAVGAGLRYIQFNNTNDYRGFVLPLPYDYSLINPTEAEKELSAKVAIKKEELKWARQEMADAWVAYYLKKEGSPGGGSGDPGLAELKDIAEEKSGRVGGLTSWRNRWMKILDELEGNRGKYLNVGKDGVLSIVIHESSEIPYTKIFGGKRTGDNITIAASRVDNGNEKITLESVKAKLPESVLTRSNWLDEAVNIVNMRQKEVAKSFGLIGEFIVGTRSRINLKPPDLAGSMPALSNSRATTTDSDINALEDFFRGVGYMLNKGKGIEKQLDKKIFPDEL